MVKTAAFVPSMPCYQKTAFLCCPYGVTVPAMCKHHYNGVITQSVVLCRKCPAMLHLWKLQNYRQVGKRESWYTSTGLYVTKEEWGRATGEGKREMKHIHSPLVQYTWIGNVTCGLFVPVIITSSSSKLRCSKSGGLLYVTAQWIAGG